MEKNSRFWGFWGCRLPSLCGCCSTPEDQPQFVMKHVANSRTVLWVVLGCKLRAWGQIVNHGKIMRKYPSSIRGTEADVSAEDLKADSWGGDQPAAPECETNTRHHLSSAYLRDRMAAGGDDEASSEIFTCSLTLPVSGSRKRSWKESCDWLSSGWM